MDTSKGLPATGIYVAWGAVAILALVILWGMGGVISDWIAGPAEPPALQAPVH